MRRRNLLALLLLALTGCQSSTAQLPAATDHWASEKWQTGCQDDQRDPYGELIEPAKCWAMVSNFNSNDDGASIGVATIFEIDHRGTRMVSNRPLDTDVCSEEPIRVAVDGRRIDQLPMSKRIEAVLAGERLVREKDRPWPYCNVYNETTTLTGARRAFDDMVQMWAAGRGAD